jgi:hypothetical protein
MTCRICYEGPDLEQNNRLISVCNCSGSTELVHEECIKKWIIISKKKQCEICHASWRNIELDFLKSAETNLECMPMLGIILGSAVAAIHALILNFHTNSLPLDYMSVILLTLMANCIHVLLWGFLKRLENDLYIKMALPTWMGIFFPLSLGLELGGKNLYMATLPYAITLSVVFVLSLLTYIKQNRNEDVPIRTNSQTSTPPNPFFEHTHGLEIELVTE